MIDDNTCCIECAILAAHRNNSHSFNTAIAINRRIFLLLLQIYYSTYSLLLSLVERVVDRYTVPYVQRTPKRVGANAAEAVTAAVARRRTAAAEMTFMVILSDVIFECWVREREK